MAKPTKKTKDYTGKGRTKAQFLSPTKPKPKGPLYATDDSPIFGERPQKQQASRKTKKSPARRKRK